MRVVSSCTTHLAASRSSRPPSRGRASSIRQLTRRRSAPRLHRRSKLTVLSIRCPLLAPLLLAWTAYAPPLRAASLELAQMALSALQVYAGVAGDVQLADSARSRPLTISNKLGWRCALRRLHLHSAPAHFARVAESSLCAFLYSVTPWYGTLTAMRTWATTALSASSPRRRQLRLCWLPPSTGQAQWRSSLDFSYLGAICQHSHSSIRKDYNDHHVNILFAVRISCSFVQLVRSCCN